MGWSSMPVAVLERIVAEPFDEVRAAIIERGIALGLTLNPTAVSTDGQQPRAVLWNYRSHAQDLLVQYADASNNFVAWTKSTCLTAALGSSDWMADQVPAYMYAAELNEVRSVLNKLTWARVPRNSGAPAATQRKGYGNSGLSYDAAWAFAKTDYAGNLFGGSFISGTAGFWASSYQGGGPRYIKEIFNHRTPDMAFDVADITVLNTKMDRPDTFTVWEGSTLTVDLFPEADWGGTPINFSSQAVIDVPTVAQGTTVHYSTRGNPEEPALDANEDSDGGKKGVAASFISPHLLVEHEFEHRA